MTKLMRRELFLKKLSSLVLMLENECIRVIVFSVHRTAEEQHKLYLEGKSQCDGYIKKSKHQDWQAADLAILNEDGTDILWDDVKYDRLGELAAQAGLTWGGVWTFRDLYHVELPSVAE